MEHIFDTHAHYNDRAFDPDRFYLLDTLRESGISGVINCGTDLESSKLSLELSKKYSFVYAACGLHPEEAEKYSDLFFSELRELLDAEKCVAVGEIGLDYHYKDDNKELQKEIFEKQIFIANERSLPVIVHDREAHGDTLEILKRTRPKGVMHCFSGSVETMNEVLALGMYIGLGGAVTFKNAKKPLEVAKAVPLDRLLLETDCPYMAPVPKRGSRNDSSLIAFTAQKIAEERGISLEELLLKTEENAKRLFLI